MFLPALALLALIIMLQRMRLGRVAPTAKKPELAG